MLNNFFSQYRKQQLSLENDVDEYHRKHKKIDYEEEEELAVHVVYASADEISRTGKGAYQKRKNRNRDYEKMWWRNVYLNLDEDQFKEKFCIFNFDHIVSIIQPFIKKNTYHSSA